MKKVHWFSSSEVTRELNISLRQLYYWELKGIVQPKMVTMGSRSFKRYSLEDIEKLRRVKRLLDEGYTLAAASKQAQNATQRS